ILQGRGPQASGRIGPFAFDDPSKKLNPGQFDDSLPIAACQRIVGISEGNPRTKFSLREMFLDIGFHLCFFLKNRLQGGVRLQLLCSVRPANLVCTSCGHDPSRHSRSGSGLPSRTGNGLALTTPQADYELKKVPTIFVLLRFDGIALALPSLPIKSFL